jgi:hypothetical protein
MESLMIGKSIVYYIPDHETALWFHIYFCLMEENLTNLSATFSSIVLDFFNFLEKNWKEILISIKTGKIPNRVLEKLKDDEKREILNYIYQDKIRYKQLKKIFKETNSIKNKNKSKIDDFEVDFKEIANKIWKNFKSISTICTGTFEIYIPSVRYFLNNDTKITSSIYAGFLNKIILN